MPKTRMGGSFLRFLVCTCQDGVKLGQMALQRHSHGTLMSTIKHHYTHHMNLGVMMAVVGMAGLGGLGMMIHQLKNPEVTFYREHPQHWAPTGGNFKKMG